MDWFAEVPDGYAPPEALGLDLELWSEWSQRNDIDGKTPNLLALEAQLNPEPRGNTLAQPELLDCNLPPGLALSEVSYEPELALPPSDGLNTSGYDLPVATPPPFAEANVPATIPNNLYNDEAILAAVAAYNATLLEEPQVIDDESEEDLIYDSVAHVQQLFDDDSVEGIQAQVNLVMPLITMKKRESTKGPRGTRLSDYEWPEEAYFISRKALTALKKVLKNDFHATTFQIKDLSDARRRESSRGYSAAQRDHRKAEAAAAGQLTPRQMESRRKNLIKTHSKLLNQVNVMWDLVIRHQLTVTEYPYVASGVPNVEAMTLDQLADVNDKLRRDMKAFQRVLVNAGGVLNNVKKASY
jgi:hypothetical protein